MDTYTLIIVLGFVTLLAALGLDFWQKARTREAEKTIRHSALSERLPQLKADPRRTDPEAVALANWVDENR